MSGQLFGNDVLFLQRLLSCCGLYKNKLDGDFGPKTNEAEQAFFAQCAAIADAEGRFDDRSERNIRSLQTNVQPLCRRSLHQLRAAGLDARVISGTRTYAEQAALFRQGRFGNPGPVVTKARAGQSWHNFGMAWDIGLFDSGQYLQKSGPYNAASAHAMVPGVEWGGNWISFKDPPHYQVPGTHSSISATREFFER